MSCSTWASPFGKGLVNDVVISLASCRVACRLERDLGRGLERSLGAEIFPAFPLILPSSGKAF
jgi:hypothetical protein